MKFAACLALFCLAWLPGARADAIPEDVTIYAVSLVDSPYRLGGDSPQTGLDCSGFVAHVFRQTTGVALPRDTRAIRDATQSVTMADLRPGDLVFFNTLSRAFSHVGIYLGDRRFVHATSSRTGRVMISSLDETYWRKRLDGARRVMPTAVDHVAIAAVD